MDNSWAQSKEEILEGLGVSLEAGLSEEEASERLKKYGKNSLESKEATPFWKLVLEQFEDPLVRILLAAAIISFILALFEEDEHERITAFFEPLVIFLILIANAVVGVLQETNAEKAIEALKQFEPEVAVVTRGGEEKTINAEDLVPGDIVTVAVGKMVPADIRVLQIQTITFRIDQKLLTGESDPVNKITTPIADPDSLQGKKNLMFKGTNCTTGQAKGIVIGTGQSTEIGKIKETIENTEQVQSPLQQKLEEFSDLLTKIIGIICIVVWAINIRQFSNPEHGGIIRGAIYYFKIAVALAVAAIPEGLPAVVTTCLALGTVKMAKKNAIVRHLPSVETLGCTSIICSDKTGTLTTSKMSVCHSVVVGSASKSDVKLIEFDIDGTTYDPVGNITDLTKRTTVDGLDSYPSLREAAVVCSLCNNSKLNYDPSSKKIDTIGEPTELALRTFSEKINSGGRNLGDYSILQNKLESDYEKLATLEFSRDRKSMSVLVRHHGAHLLLVKGATESILDRCDRVLLNDSKAPVPLTPEIRAQLDASLDRMSGRALRVLGFAIVPNARSVEEYDFSPENYIQYEQNMIFIGMAGMLDPPRPEVAPALAICRSAGIEVIVITGDNKNTAEAICRKIGLFGEDEDLKNRSLTGREWDSLDHAQKVEKLKTVRLFSRTEPVHKSDIVQILQSQKNVVAMTGDGVNDAPALKIANIGIGMGSGTDVAKAASDMILSDDNFATIVSAVEEGRAIYSNTKQFIRYLISSNIGEVACIFFTAALGIPEALIPVQLLWVNLVTDGLPATALGFNPPDLDIMERPPRSSSEKIINGAMFFRYMVIGVYVGIATVGGFLYWYLEFSEGPQLSLELLKMHDKCVGELRPGLSCHEFELMNRTPSTVALSVLVTIEMFNAMNSLSENQSLLKMPPWKNFWLIGATVLSFSLHFVIVYVPFFADIFQVAPISLKEWYIVLAFSFPVVILDEIFKFFTRLFYSAKH